jgi:hypothetical protein
VSGDSGASIQREADARQESSGRETNELALISLVLGIFWIFGFGSIAAIYLGHRALREIADPARNEGGRAFAWAGIASGIFGLTSTAMVIAIGLGS